MLQRLLLEQPGRLLVVWVIAQFLLICLWSWRRSRPTARAAWVGFGLLPVLLGISFLVVTPRERIIHKCHDMARHVQQGDVFGLAMHLAEDFQTSGRDREAFVSRVEEALERYRVDRVRLSRFEVTLRSEFDATAEFHALATVRSADALFDRVPSRWELLFRREGDEWRVYGLRSLPTPFSPIRSPGRWLD